MESINERYLNLVIAYLSVLNEQIEPSEINGCNGYQFQCPFCSHLVKGEKTSKRRTAHLIRTCENSWVFNCCRRWSNECRGGHRSFHNFLAMLNPSLFKRYQKDLATL